MIAGREEDFAIVEIMPVSQYPENFASTPASQTQCYWPLTQGAIITGTFREILFNYLI
jgi:hypothetical protein